MSKNLYLDFLKNEKSFRSEINVFFYLVSQVVSFKREKETSSNVADTTLKNITLNKT